MKAREALEWMATYKAGLSRKYAQLMHGHMVGVMLRAEGIMDGRVKETYAVGNDLVERINRSMPTAEAYFLSKDMAHVIEWASRTLEPTDVFEREMWPTPSGFMVYEDMMLRVDARGIMNGTKALYWMPARGDDGSYGTLLIHLTDAEDERDETTLQIMEHESVTRNEMIGMAGRLQPIHIEYIPHGSNVGDEEFFTKDLLEGIPSPYGMPVVLDKVANPRRFTLAMLMMLNQTITVTEREEVAKKHRASYAKRRLPSTVTVIRMRRIKGASRGEGESHVEWAHRWIVRGHWRNQACGEGRKEHRRIWIAPFVKGPEGMPFVQSEKVIALVR